MAQRQVAASHRGFDPEIAPALEEELRVANDALARESAVGNAVRSIVHQMAASLAETSESDFLEVDPYLVVALQQGALGSLLALEERDEAAQRRQVRLRLEQMRQALRDIAEGLPVREDRPAKDVARWLAGVLNVPQTTLAELIGTSPRTFQRWVSPRDPAQPAGEDAWRLRIVARIANNLRHALTGQGVVNWFSRPHPDLKGASPASLLEDPTATERLVKLAASARSSGAS